jgi:hypothetical protein
MEIYFNHEKVSWSLDGTYTLTYNAVDNTKTYLLTNCDFGGEFETTGEPGALVRAAPLTSSYRLYHTLDGVRYTILATAPTNAFPLPVRAVVADQVGIGNVMASLLNRYFVNMSQEAPPTPTNVRIQIDFTGCTIWWESAYDVVITFSNPVVSEKVEGATSPYHFTPGIGQSDVWISAVFDGLESVAAETGAYTFFLEPPTPSVSAVREGAAIRVSWGAEDNGCGVTRRLYRSVNPFLGEVFDVSGNEYTDLDVKAGQTYYYFLLTRYDDPNRCGLLQSPAPAIVEVRMPLQTYIPLWNQGFGKASALATFYVSLSDVADAFEIDVNEGMYYFHVDKFRDVLAMNPAFAVVTKGAVTTVDAKGEPLSSFGMMAENDYIRFLAEQRFGNPSLAVLIQNKLEILADVQTQCAGAVENVKALLNRIDAASSDPAGGMLKTEKGWGFTETDASPLNLTTIFLDNLQANGRFRGLTPRLPFIEGDSFLFELVFQTADAISRYYYIQYVMRDVVPAQPATSSMANVNWFK